MKKSAWVIFIILLIIIGLVVWAIFAFSNQPGSTAANTASSTTVSSGTAAAGGVMLPAFDMSLSDGTVKINYPSTDFGLAVNETQLSTVHSYIPPCAQGFNYCFYYTGNRYAGTNFESAGIAWTKRTDLKTQSSCLNTQPEGYSGLVPVVATSSDYATAGFLNTGGAAAGHFANDNIYRVYYNGTCEEFDERVGQSDYLNYPSGSIQQFTTGDEAAIQFEMGAILGTMTLSNGEQVSLPQSSSSTVIH